MSINILLTEDVIAFACLQVWYLIQNSCRNQLNKIIYMLKKIKSCLRNQKNSELKITLGEAIRDSLIKNGIETVTESAYTASNATEKLVGTNCNQNR